MLTKQPANSRFRLIGEREDAPKRKRSVRGKMYNTDLVRPFKLWIKTWSWSCSTSTNIFQIKSFYHRESADNISLKKALSWTIFALVSFLFSRFGCSVLSLSLSTSLPLCTSSFKRPKNVKETLLDRMYHTSQFSAKMSFSLYPAWFKQSQIETLKTLWFEAKRGA